MPTGKTRYRWKSRAGRGISLALIALFLTWGLAASGVLTGWENRTWDWRSQLLASPAEADEDIVLILLDQESLDWARHRHSLSWPWPRELYAAIIDFCRRGDAAALGFDVLLLDSSSYGVADDRILGEAVAALDAFSAAVFLGENSGEARRWPENWPVFKAVADHPGLPAPAFPRASLPIAEVGTNAALLGNVQLAPDADTVYRRAPLFASFDGQLLPVLGLAPYFAAHRQASIARSDNGLEIDSHTIPIDQKGRAILRYHGPAGTFPAYSAAAVLQSEIRLRQGEETALDPALFQDKYVFFGFSAPGLYDLRPTPMGGLSSGVEIHAAILDNLLNDHFIKPVALGPALAISAPPIVAGAVLLSLLTALPWLVVVSAALVIWPLLPALAAYQAGWWLPLAAPLLAAVMVLLLVLLTNFVIEGRQKRFIKSAFQQYLSPAVIEELVQNPGLLKLGGERRELSIFFSDLEGFTSISEGMEPETLTALLNDYLTAMTSMIQQTGGTVDKFEGDAIIAFWNAPLLQNDHARRALETAIACQALLTELRPAFKQRCGHELRMRIGINSGPAVVGNLGSISRFDYTMLGDAVNLAARLEGANKEFGIYTLVAAQTVQAAGDDVAALGEWLQRPAAAEPPLAVVRELGRLQVVGRLQAVTVYEPMSPAAAALWNAELASFDQGLRLFYDGDFTAACKLFAGLAERDPAAAAYLVRCRQLLADPPPQPWDGIWRLSSK